MKRMRSLKDRCVLITGAAGGIGSELARRLLFREGARLILIDKDLEGLRRLEKELEQASTEGRVQVFEADLANMASIRTLVERIENQSIDVLVNNAGIIYNGTFAGMDLDDFESVVSVNLYAPIRLTRLLLAKLIASRGAVVNVASGAGLLGIGGINAYATSKFGLVGFSESLRAELRGRVGVGVLCLCFVRTPIARSMLLPSDASPEEGNKQLQRIDRMVQRNGMRPERVAKVIVKMIKKDKGLVLLGLSTRFLWGVKRWFPPLTDLVNRLIFLGLVKRGYVRTEVL